VLGGDVVNQLHHVHGLADTGAPEQADLATFGKRTNEIDHLDAGLEELIRRSKLFIGGCSTVNGRALLLTNRTFLINGVAQHVHDPTQRLCAYRYRDRRTGVFHIETAAHALGGAHGNRAHHTVAQLLLHFEGESFIAHHQCVIHLGHAVTGELHVDDGADNLYDLSATHFPVLVSHSVQRSHRCVLSFQRSALSADGCGASHNLCQLLRNRSLAGFVVDKLKFFDQLARVVRGVFHGDHARRLLTGAVLDHCLIHL